MAPAFFGAGKASRSDVTEWAEELWASGSAVGVILCDTGRIVTSALDGDARHHVCVGLFTGRQPWRLAEPVEDRTWSGS